MVYVLNYLLNNRLITGACLVLSSLTFCVQTASAAQAYLDDADTAKPSSNSSLPSISGHKFPRTILAETQSMKGDLEKYSKYKIISTGGEVLNKIEDIQAAHPDVMYFRAANFAEYLEYDYTDVWCASGHSIPFENTGNTTDGCSVYAGHWLYKAGSTTKQSMTTSSTSVQVADASRFTSGEYAVIYDSPAGSFNNAEHVKITARNTSNNTLTVSRAYKSTARSHGNGSIIAQHVTGQGGSVLNWSFNVSNQSPKDGNGRIYTAAAVNFYKNNYTKTYKGESTKAKVHGFLFDSDFYSLFGSKEADVNNDLKTDDGLNGSGTNWWGTGLENFYASMRSTFPNLYIISGHQLARGFDSLNGTQMEGWPQSNDYHSVNPEYNTLNSEFANYRFYMHYVASGPAASHVLTKTPTDTYPDGTNASSDKAFRFALGMGLLEDGYFGSQNSSDHPDVWYDEFSVNTDSSSNYYGEAVAANPADETDARATSGWMGSPTGTYTRIYDDATFAPSASLIPAGTFDSDISGWSGTNVNLSRDTSTSKDGSASLKSSAHTSYQAELYNAKINGPSVTLNKGTYYTLVFTAKAGSDRIVKAQVGSYGEQFYVGTSWRRYVMSFPAADSSSQKVSFYVGQESTTVNLDSVYLFKGNANVFRRDFDNGIVVTNGTPSSVTVNLGGTFQRISGKQDPSTNNGQSLSQVTIPAWDAAILVRPKGTSGGGGGGGTTNPPPSGTDICQKPSYDPNSQQGIFIWKDCSNNVWRVRASAGGNSNGVDYVGSIYSSGGFSKANPVSIESHDTLDKSNSYIDFVLRVWGGGEDGINFTVPNSASTCFEASSTASNKIYLGPDKVQMSSSFDLNTLGACN